MIETASAPRLVVISGAGLSAESGLRTFRDADGLWEGHDVHEVCNIDTWRRNLTQVHRFYSERRAAAVEARPNAAHQAMARWQARWPTMLLTQNVDPLLEQAGCHDVVHLHGRLEAMQCHDCGHEWDHGLAPWSPETDACPRCGSHDDVKPGIVFFGERAPLYSTLFQTLESLRPQDVLLVVGTAGQVLPVADFARFSPATNILNNLDESPLIPSALFTHTFYMPATQAADLIEKVLVTRLG